MTPVELAGRQVAAAIRSKVAEAVAERAEAGAGTRLAVVTATRDEALAWYVRSIEAAATRVGIECRVCALDELSSPQSIGAALDRLTRDPTVDGLMLQTPLPGGARLADLAAAIGVGKDIDGANPLSLGRIACGLPAFAPATAAAVIAILDHHGIRLAGAGVVVVGRSTVVGKPLAHLLLGRDATVTVCHSRTPDLAVVTRRADIVVAAAGRAGLITGEHLRAGAIVVDVGTNPTADGGLVGDVDAGSVAEVAGALTPVPGGVGPVTTALLLRNTVLAARGGYPGADQGRHGWE